MLSVLKSLICGDYEREIRRSNRVLIEVLYDLGYRPRVYSSRLYTNALILKELVKDLTSKVEAPPSIDVFTLDEAHVYEMLSLLPNFDVKRWFRLDATYYTTTLEGFKKIIEWDRTNMKEYILDMYDCEDYSFHFKSNVAWFFNVNAVAIVLDYSAQHAYNLILTADVDEPLIYEPQLDVIMSISERDTQFYKLEEYYILL
jgi:hypothetical protein